MKNFSYYMPTRIFFGAGSVKKLSRAPLPAGRGLLITGGSSTTKLGYVDKVCAALAEAGHEMTVYRDVQPNPTIENVRECAAIAREQACTFVVGLGGGSSIDTAKAAAVMATNDGDWWDYVYGGSGKGQKIKNQPCRSWRLRRLRARARKPTPGRSSPTARKRLAAVMTRPSRRCPSSIPIL